VIVVTPDRSITYPSAEYFKDVVNKKSLDYAQAKLLVVIDGRRVHGIDSTAVKVNIF